MEKKIPLEEQQTTINMYGDSKTAEVYTNTAKWKNRLLKLAEQFPDEVTVTTDQWGGIIATLPTKYVKIRGPVKREVTQEAIDRLRQGYQNYRNGADSTTNSRDISDSTTEDE